MIPDDKMMSDEAEMYLRETIHSLHVNLTSAFLKIAIWTLNQNQKHINTAKCVHPHEMASS